jgi:hypothetical protein
MNTQDTDEHVYFALTAIQEYEERCRLEAVSARRLSDQIPGTIDAADSKPIAEKIPKEHLLTVIKSPAQSLGFLLKVRTRVCKCRIAPLPPNRSELLF